MTHVPRSGGGDSPTVVAAIRTLETTMPNKCFTEVRYRNIVYRSRDSRAVNAAVFRHARTMDVVWPLVSRMPRYDWRRPQYELWRESAIMEMASELADTSHLRLLETCQREWERAAARLPSQAAMARTRKRRLRGQMQGLDELARREPGGILASLDRGKGDRINERIRLREEAIDRADWKRVWPDLDFDLVQVSIIDSVSAGNSESCSRDWVERHMPDYADSDRAPASVVLSAAAQDRTETRGLAVAAVHRAVLRGRKG